MTQWVDFKTVREHLSFHNVLAHYEIEAHGQGDKGMREQLTRLQVKPRSEQKKRWVSETKARQERFNKGLRGLFDRITGIYSKTKHQYEHETYQSALRDQKQRDALIFKHMQQKKEFTLRMTQTIDKPKQIVKELRVDTRRLKPRLESDLRR